MRKAVAALLTGLALSGVPVGPGWLRAEPAQRPAEAVDTTPIGKIVSVKGTATVEHVSAVILQASVSSGAGQAKVGDFVYRGDIILTGASSALGITFSDGTAFNIASNARMVLNEFVYDPKGKSNSSLFRISKGVITFVAGQVAKTGDMKIETPVATMGIRGTTPHVEIAEDGSVSFSSLAEDNKPKLERRGSNDDKSKDEKSKNAAAPAPEEQKDAAPKQGEEKNNKKKNAKRGKGKKAVKRADKQPDPSPNINIRICRGC